LGKLPYPADRLVLSSPRAIIRSIISQRVFASGFTEETAAVTRPRLV
jgi:hypothetical protein